MPSSPTTHKDPATSSTVASRTPWILKNYINGQWVEARDCPLLDVENPSTAEVIAQVPLCTATQANQALEAAHAAFPEWSRMPVSRRVGYLRALLNLILANEEDLARMITRENGKSLADARAEMKRLIENIEVACGMPILQAGDVQIGNAYDIDGEVIRLPIGVFAMIPPFNFPAMVPFWFLPYALASGNTYVVKPSEQVPCTMQMITQFMDQSGIPPGVFNLINGDKTVGQAFLDSPILKGVSMVGSSAVARHVATRCAETNKRFQAMGSAKNHLVVMPDAVEDEAVRNMLTSCYGCAGQRCMAASAIVCVGEETYHSITEKFISASKETIVADPLDPKFAENPMVLGPVISGKARERIFALIEDGVREGATLALDGRNVKVEGNENGYFIGPTVFTDVKPGMKIHRTEIFGPVVVMLKADSLDEAITMINEHEYGNGASIYTQSGYYARKFKLEAEAGMIGVNVGIPAPVASLPFGGMKASQFADIKTQGKAVVNFFTEDKIITQRFWPEG